jgi:hypothetical protein
MKSSKKLFGAVPFEALERELRHVLDHYPLFPGHALDRAALAEICRRGWVVQQADGGFIPTARGVFTAGGLQ